MDRKTNGFWSIAARKHLKEFVDYSDNSDIFDRLNVAGKKCGWKNRPLLGNDKRK